MLERVLFSTLGMTDPMKNDFDGPMLHILRHFRPGKVYLFMTKRVCELADQDNRYRLQIEYLCSKLGFNCEIIELRYQEIDNPQQFDIFYPIFEKEIIRIHKENPHSQLLFNLSSGTPQMKSACHLLALTIGFPVIPIQVTTPNEQENYGTPVFNAQEEWKNNLDNHPELEVKNRCIVVESTNLRFLFLREAAISHIRAYEYGAALEVLKGVEEFIPDSAIRLLQAARHRKNMELALAIERAKQAGYDLIPVKGGDVMELFEYLLVLKIQQQSKDLINFVRGISPALSRLFECFLEKKCQRRIKQQFCYKAGRNQDIYILSREKLSLEKELLAHYDASFIGYFRDSPLSAAVLLPMITYECGPKGNHANNVVFERAKLLRNVEEGIRNMAAHTISAVTEKDFHEKAGVSSQKALEYLLWFFQETYPEYFTLGKSCWESYTEMNEKIIAILK